MAKNHTHTLTLDSIFTFSEAINHPFSRGTQLRSIMGIPYSKHRKSKEMYELINHVQDCFLRDQKVPSERLIMISTAANWSEFRKVTGQNTNFWLRQNGKFWFGRNRDDLSAYEKDLMSKYGWGTGVDFPAYCAAAKQAPRFLQDCHTTTEATPFRLQA